MHHTPTSIKSLSFIAFSFENLK
uniref:Uncharacterized protein n=1 Tax=Rhizophora mucronata TaxID=61149 RepID=A0A2P2PIN5_RHIMU